MKTLRDFITESEQWVDNPATGDDFALDIRQECLLETYIVDVREDGVVLHADQRMIELLEQHGAILETIRRYGAVGSSTGQGYTLAEKDAALDDDGSTDKELQAILARAGVKENANSNDPLLAKSIDDAAVPAMEAVDPRLQALVGREFYVKSAGRRGHVDRVSPDHRNAVIVQFDDGDMDVVHFSDLATDDPSFMRKMMDRMRAPLADRPVKIREESQHMLSEREIDIDGFRFDVDGVIEELRAWFDHLDSGEYLGDTTVEDIEHALTTGSPDARALWQRMQDLPQQQFRRVVMQIVNHAYKAETDEYNRAEQDDEGGIAVDNLREGKFINPEDMYVYGNKFGYVVWGPGSGLMLTDPQGNAREYWGNIRYSEIQQLIQQRGMEAVSIESLPGRIQKKFLYQLNDIIDPSLGLMGQRRLVGKGGAPNPSRDQLAVRQGLPTSRLKNQIRMEPDFLKGPEGALPEGAAKEGLKEVEDDSEQDGDPYEMGYNAAWLYRRSKNSNPFEFDDPRNYEWEDGWRDGDRQARSEGASEDDLDEASCMQENARNAETVYIEGCGWDSVVAWLNKNVGPTTTKNANYMNGWFGQGWQLYPARYSDKSGKVALQVRALTDLPPEGLKAKIENACRRVSVPGAREKGLGEASCMREDRISMVGGLSRDLMHWYRPQMMQALEQHGIETVMDTIDSVADQHADAEEMGTSDRHNLCRQALEQLGISAAAMRNELGGLEIDEAEYQGRDVPLGKPMRGDVKKFKVYVRDPSTGNIKKVNFGHGGTSAKKAGQETMRIKKSNPERRRNFRARHRCDTPGPRTKARYWSCRMW